MRKGLIAIATAASIAAGIGIASPASAQYYGGDHRYDHRWDRHHDWRRHDHWREHRHWHHDRYGYGYGDRPHYNGYYGW